MTQYHLLVSPVSEPVGGFYSAGGPLILGEHHRDDSWGRKQWVNVLSFTNVRCMASHATDSQGLTTQVFEDALAHVHWKLKCICSLRPSYASSVSCR